MIIIKYSIFINFGYMTHPSGTTYTCVLGKNGIKELLAKGDIVIDPYDENQVNCSSYDVTLSEHYFMERKRSSLLFPYDGPTTSLSKYVASIPVFNPYLEKHVKEKWGELQTAHTISEILEHKDTTYSEYQLSRKSFRDDDDTETTRVIILPPNGIILALTNEKIGGVKDYTGMMKSKSSSGRCCLRTCNDAGWGDPGYFNKWTMEIKNESQEHATILYVGARIAQIVFMKVDNVGDGNRYTEVSTSKYVSNSSHNHSQNVGNLMLPKLYKTNPSPKLVKKEKEVNVNE